MLEEPKVEGIRITFDPETQSVNVKFDPEKFRTWDFVVAVIDMAKEQAIGQKKMAQMQAMQQMQLQAQRDAAIAQQLNGKRIQF